MIKKKQLLAAIAVCGVMSSALAGSLVEAKDDNISYKFRIGSYQTNGQDPNGRYRETGDVNNPWKVKMTSSGEGSGTVTNYWLENSNDDNVSSSVSVKQGKGFYYNNPNSSANKTTVYLTAENNNYDGSAYNVAGYWDEETW